MNLDIFTTSSCAFVTQKAKSARQYAPFLDLLTAKSMSQAKTLLPKIMDQKAHFQHRQ